MKKPTTQILKRLPPASLAAPVLNAAFRHDRPEIDRIIACVPRRNNVFCPDPEYLFTRQFLESRLLSLGVTYWRNAAFAGNANAQMLASPDVPTPQLLELDAEHRLWKRAALLADRYLGEICAIAGLDEPATRAFLSVPPADETPLTDAEQTELAKLVAEFKTELAKVSVGV